MMKRLALFALLVIAALPNAAQSQNIIVANCGTVPASVITLTAGNQGPNFIDTTGKLCTAGGGGAATIADGADVAQGTTTDSACATDNGTCTEIALTKRTNQRLTTVNTTLGTPMQATGGTVGVVAGTAVIGKVGIDQTTVGTTNLVTKQFDRSFLVPISFTQAASYAAGNAMGPTGAGNAKQTLDISAAAGVSMANAKVKLRGYRGNVTAGTITAVVGVQINLFPTAPAGTFTDAAMSSLTQADAVILQSGISVQTAAPTGVFNGAGAASPGSVIFTTVLSQDAEITCDSSGHLTLVIQSGGTQTYTTPTGFNLTLEFTR